MGGPLSFLLSSGNAPERAARLRELRALALVFCGPAHPATTALMAAVVDPAQAGHALAVAAALPAPPKRRLLCTFGSLMR
jgi:hypothetical protein